MNNLLKTYRNDILCEKYKIEYFDVKENKSKVGEITDLLVLAFVDGYDFGGINTCLVFSEQDKYIYDILFENFKDASTLPFTVYLLGDNSVRIPIVIQEGHGFLEVDDIWNYHGYTQNGKKISTGCYFGYTHPFHCQTDNWKRDDDKYVLKYCSNGKQKEFEHLLDILSAADSISDSYDNGFPTYLVLNDRCDKNDELIKELKAEKFPITVYVCYNDIKIPLIIQNEQDFPTPLNDKFECDDAYRIVGNCIIARLDPFKNVPNRKKQ